MNEKLKLKTSIGLKITRIVIFLVIAFIVLCAIEALRGEWIEQTEAIVSFIKGIWEEVSAWL